MLQDQTLIPGKFSYSLTCCPSVQAKFNHKFPSFLWSPSFLLFAVRFSNANRSAFSSCILLCRLSGWEAPDSDLLHSPRLLSITARPPCYFFSSREFLRQTAVLSRPQKYLSHCTTEICKTICQGEV